MQSENFDNKIREAASHHHPAYDETAWVRMKNQLDKYLPQEKDKRRGIIFFLFLFLLLGGGGIWILSSKNRKENGNVTNVHKSLPKSAGDKNIPIAATREKLNTGDSKLNEEDHKIKNEDDALIIVPGNDNTPSTSTQTIAGLKNTVQKNDRKHKMIKVSDQQMVKNAELHEKDKKWAPLKQGKEDPSKANNTAPVARTDQKEKNKYGESGNNLSGIATMNSKPEVKDQPVRKEIAYENNSPVQPSTIKKKKDKNNKRNTIFFSLSAGPDVSATPGDRLGTSKLLVGGGVGYTIKDKLTISSGFYRARKIYTSSPESYHPPASFWNYYPYLEKVDGDCNVYEIPLTLSYHFGHSSKQNWFVSSGLSSYIMKKETYKYYYKYAPNGQTVTRQYTPTDKNNNYFSVLTLSGGYQKNIGKNFFVKAEPYIKLPLNGVGLGNVKLNSGGVLISFGVKPFVQSKKHVTVRH